MYAFLPPSLPTALPTALPRPQLHRHRPITCQTSPPALSNVLIIAANRGLGSHLLSHLSSTPSLHSTHRPQTPPSASQTACSALDALDRENVFDVIDHVRPKTVISCIGGDLTQDELPDFDGNKNIIDACIKGGVDRFVLISAMGAGDSENTVPFQVMHTLRPLLLEKSHAEAYLKGVEGLKWSIVRPAPLVEEEGADSAVATEELNCYGTITRPSLARMVANIAASEKAIGKTLHVVDSERLLITSPYVRPLEFWETIPFEIFNLV